MLQLPSRALVRDLQPHAAHQALLCALNHLDTEMHVCVWWLLTSSFHVKEKRSGPLCDHIVRMGSLDPYLALQNRSDEVEKSPPVHIVIKVVKL